jgi:hypothetical protein
MHDRKSTPAAAESRALYVKAGVAIGLTLLTALVCWTVPEPKAGGEAGVEMDLPTRVGAFYDFDEEVTAAELYILPKDTTFVRKTYGDIGSARQDRILCSVILSGAERRSIHRPERCLPSQGWRIDSSHTETVPLTSGRDLKVTALLLEKHVNLANGAPFTLRSYYLYWFVGKDITTPSQTTRILMTYWDMLVHRVNQRWAYVIVSKDISRDWRTDGLDADQTLALLKQFIHDSVPAYMKSEMPAPAAK